MKTRNSTFETSISWVINQVLEKVEAKHQTVVHSNIIPLDDFEQPSATDEEKSHLLLLPYHGQKGDFALKSIRKRLKTLLPNSVNMQITFKCKKINWCFKIKDTVNFEHKNDLAYHEKCSTNNCKDDYVGETKRRISERIRAYNGRDVNSHLLKHYMEEEHECLQNKDFVILRSGFSNNTVKERFLKNFGSKI